MNELAFFGGVRDGDVTILSAPSRARRPVRCIH